MPVLRTKADHYEHPLVASIVQGRGRPPKKVVRRYIKDVVHGKGPRWAAPRSEQPYQDR